MSDTANATIEVFADIWCPFAHVGLRTFYEQRSISGRSDLGVRIRPWPLELVNGTPLDPATTRAHVDDLREQVAPMLFRHFDPDHFPSSTLPALALAECAYRTDLRLGERTSFALRDALFEEGRDISDPAVLRGMSDELGLEIASGVDDDAVLSGWHEGQRRGVKGSPHFFCGNRNIFCPSLQITKGQEQDMEIVRDTARLTDFLEQCFADGQTAPPR